MTMTIGASNDAQNEKKELTTEEVLFAKLKQVSDELERIKAQQPAAFQNAQLAEMVGASIAAVLKDARKEKNYEAGIEEEQIDPNDYDEKGVRFYSPSVGYFMSDDKRMGQIVVMPYKRKVFFEHLATRIQGAGKHNTTAPISLYISHSYKEQKWIREHTLYGTMFYETEGGISHDDAARAARTAQIMTVVKNYEITEVLKRCAEYNVPRHENYDIMRQRLVMKMAEREVEVAAEKAKQMIQDTYKGSLLLGRTS